MSNPGQHWTAEEKLSPASILLKDDVVLSRIACVFLIGIAVWLLVLGAANLQHPSDWAMGDWLINYSGGFVRRGLTGSLALLLAEAHLPLLWTIFLLQCGCYALVLGTVWRLIRGLHWRWWSAAFFFSPATLAFVLLEPSFAFRKEVLFFSLLGLTLRLVRPDHVGRVAGTAWLSLLLALGCSTCVLSHEGLIVYFPYLVAAVWLGCRDAKKSFQVLGPAFLLSGALFVLVYHYPGNPAEAAVVCRSIGGTLTYPPSGICGGAIEYLRRTPAAAHADVLRVYTGASLYLLPWLFLLPMLPAALGLAEYLRTDPKVGWVLTLCTSLAWIMSATLFWYGTDWTRWIYIHVLSLLLLMLFTEQRHSHVVSRLLAREGPSQRGTLHWLGIGALLIYCLGWNLTVYGQRPLYTSFFRYVTHSLLQTQPRGNSPSD